MSLSHRPQLLFVLEGNTDIRFVSGLCEYFDLTILGPQINLNRKGGLLERIKKEKLSVKVIEIPGGRLKYQLLAFLKLLKVAREFDALFSQENLRGTLNAGIVGRLKGVPVLSHSGMPPREYFHCRFRRGEISRLKFWVGDLVIRSLLFLNAKLCHHWFVLGPFLYEVFSPYKKEIGPAHYYGVDVDLYRPVSAEEKLELRKKQDFNDDDFIIFFSSRVSHEKDPETVLNAVHQIYNQDLGHKVLLMNLGGGHQKIRELALDMGLNDIDEWLVTRPAAHPMYDLPQYYQLSDLVIQSSLEEGLGLSPLEALACNIPVIASNVGGMKAHLSPFATMVEPRAVESMREAILSHINDNGERPHEGRDYVCHHWNKNLAFENLSMKIYELIKK